MAIGIFDSGLGGLSVVKELKKKYPSEKIIYFADNINLPYGEKTDEEIKSFAINICDFLISKGATSIIIACNTASSTAYDILIKKYSIPIYSIILPVVNEILNKDYKKIGLIATKSTINSKKYDKYLDGVLSLKKATPKLVEYAESQCKTGILEYIKDNIDNMVKNTDAIILGCTHFPLLAEYFNKLYSDFTFIDPAVALVKSFDIKDSEIADDEYYVSGEKAEFELLAKNIIGSDINVRVHKW